MKIEIGESLVYSWLRHIKNCQIVQTNWKTSPRWNVLHKTELETMFNDLIAHFGRDLFKKTTTVEQLLQQGECDLFGVRMDNGIPRYYVAEVAFHGSGLNYGSRRETVMKVVAKCIRAAFCLYGYFDIKEGEILFATPMAGPTKQADIEKCLLELNQYFTQNGFAFSAKLICNKEFDDTLLHPTLDAVEDAEDTAELFARAYKLLQMFEENAQKSAPRGSKKTAVLGLLNSMITAGKMTPALLTNLQDPKFAQATFKLSSFPVLVKASAFAATGYNKNKFYTDKIKIFADEYLVCSQWTPNTRYEKLQEWCDNL